MSALPASWIPREQRIDHAERRRMRESGARVKWCCGARRTGKSSDGIDYLLLGHGPEGDNGLRLYSGALLPPDVPDPTFVAAAPTREMVKRLWWERLKARLTSDWIESANETDLCMRLVNGSRLLCVGMDRPSRSEGFAIDGLVGDEYAYWHEGAFERSLRPALSTRGRPGWAILMFKPNGRNHAYDAWDKARRGEVPGHEAFHWTGAAVLSPDELAIARATMDARSYEQEYEASFLQRTGRVYYAWDPTKHVRPVVYDPSLPLVFALDFNVSPGAAVAIQEQLVDGEMSTCCVWEHYVKDDNHSTLMCQRFSERFRGHKAAIYLYGDVGGHQRRTSAKDTDWTIVLAELRKGFADVRMRVGHAVQSVTDGVNSLNTRLQRGDGKIQFYVAGCCRETIRDFEGVVWNPSPHVEREIDKSEKARTHWVDAIRYYVHEKHPISGGRGFVIVTNGVVTHGH